MLWPERILLRLPVRKFSRSLQRNSGQRGWPNSGIHGSGGVCSNISANSPYSCAGTFQSGSFLLFFGSERASTETCGATGGGFTLIPGTAGCSTASASNLAVAYVNSASAGAVTGSVAFSPSPLSGTYWERSYSRHTARIGAQLYSGWDQQSRYCADF